MLPESSWVFALLLWVRQEPGKSGFTLFEDPNSPINHFLKDLIYTCEITSKPVVQP